MKRSVDDYLNLITSEHKPRPKFNATVATTVAPLASLQVMVEHMPIDFDLDVAIGKQLDAVGERIGRSRYIPQPLPNVWFAFDTPRKGFDNGWWKGPFDVGTMLDRLDDENYRRLLFAKIDANNWNGLISTAQAALDEFFVDPLTHVMVVDEANVATVKEWFAFDRDIEHGFDGKAVWYEDGAIVATLPALNMMVTIGVSGKIPPVVDLEVFIQGLIPLSIGGVDQRVLVTSIDGARLFGFDIDNVYLGGFDEEDSAWGVPPQKLVDLLVDIDSITSIAVEFGLDPVWLADLVQSVRNHGVKIEATRFYLVVNGRALNYADAVSMSVGDVLTYANRTL